MLGAVDYDLVLLDILMPRLDGFAVLERMKADERLRHVPVIVISALEETVSVVRCLQMGADDYVTKPFDAVILRARVTACLEKKHLRDREKAQTRQLQELNEILGLRVTETTEDLKRRVRELTALTEASRAINSVMNTDRLLEQILELSREVMTAEASSLLVLEQETGKLQFVVARGTAGPALKSTTVDIGQGIAGWVAQTGEPLLIADAYQDPRFDPSYDQLTGFHTRSILTVPIVIKGEIEGVVQVINKVSAEVFDERDLRLFQSFASMASIALENARLFERTRRMADDLREALEAERRLSIEKEKMGAYVPKTAVDEIVRNREQKLALGGKLVRATILFSDLEGFTRLTETMAPQAVVSFLNEYMTAMTRVVEDGGGMVDKFIGDGIMAVFLPVDGEDNHALRGGARGRAACSSAWASCARAGAPAPRAHGHPRPHRHQHGGCGVGQHRLPDAHGLHGGGRQRQPRRPHRGQCARGRGPRQRVDLPRGRGPRRGHPPRAHHREEPCAARADLLGGGARRPGADHLDLTRDTVAAPSVCIPAEEIRP